MALTLVLEMFDRPLNRILPDHGPPDNLQQMV
jgi:hypothetical protein